MSEKKKFDMTEFMNGLKTIFTPNCLLLVAINASNQFTNNMKNGFRVLIGTRDIGLTPALIGTLVSIFMLAGLLCRTPAGGLVDTKRDKIKTILSTALICKVIVFAAFGFVTGQAAYTVLFVVDGIIWSFIGTALPALLALSVDRRAMGSAYAVFMGITTIVSGPARPLGISLYTNHGARYAALAASGLTLITLVLVQLMNGKKLAESAEQLKARVAGKPAPQKKSKLAGFSVRLLPLAIVAAIPIIMFNLESNYLPNFAAETGYEYLAATATGASLAGVVGIAAGFLCDVINPSILVYAGFLGQLVGGIMMGKATSSSMLSTGVLIYYLTRQLYGNPMKIIGMKAASASEQGAWQATSLLCNDAVGVVVVPILGILIQNVGYANVFTGCGVFMSVAIIGYFILSRKFLTNLNAPEEA